MEKEYEKVLQKVLKKYPERKREFISGSSEKIKRLYTAKDTKEIDYEKDIGYPGIFPFTRGVQPTMYRGRLWTMRQYAGFGNAEDSNKRYKYLLSQGQTGLSIAFDLCTQIGLDSDNKISAGEVGKVGVAIDSLEDMEILFDDIPLDKVSTSMTINAPAAILLMMYVAVAEKQNVAIEKLKGTIQNDILKEYIARGTYIFPPKPSMRLITDTFAFCSKNIPAWNTISVSGYHIREAGSTAAQEIAFTIANGIAYVEAAVDAGLSVDEFAPRISFFFNAHNDLVEEVAKFRAARKIWAKIMKDRFKAKEPRSRKLRFHTQTGGSTLTAQQPDNNIVRVTIQALAAVLGGTQSLHTNSRDEALALPTEESVRIALRTQQIIAHESGLTNTIDPLAGSYYVERMTKNITKKVMQYIEEIDNRGGMINAIEEGYPQQKIQDNAYNYQKQIEDDERIIVGVNKYQIKEKSSQNILKLDKEVEKNQIRKVKSLRLKRDNNRVKKSLARIEKIASTDENILPAILAAVKDYATLGEICEVLRDKFGEYRQQLIY